MRLASVLKRSCASDTAEALEFQRDRDWSGSHNVKQFKITGVLQGLYVHLTL